MILVTGGTGLVGSHLLYALVSKGEKVRATRRKGSNLANVKKVFDFLTDKPRELFDRIKWVEADITNIPQLQEAFTGITQVYHSAAFISFDSADGALMRKINIEGTANIVNQSIRHQVKKLCYVSSIASLGPEKKNGYITEESYWNPEADNNDYAISKYGGEMEVWRGTREGVPAIIVNPGVILGAGFPDQGSGKLFSMAKKGMSFYTDGETGFVDVEDVTAIMIQLMEGDFENENYILIGENVSFKKVMTQICSALGKKPPKKKIKRWMLHILWRLQWIFSKLSGKSPAITRASARAAFEKSAYANTKIKVALSFEFTPLKNTIQKVAGRF
jgi:dihydroflavonol-4-reductase